MNERIKALLLNERNKFVNGVTESNNKIYIHGSEENLEKFAELIVKECVKIVRPNSYSRAYPDNMIGGEDGVRLLDIVADQIEEHFDIEVEE